MPKSIRFLSAIFPVTDYRVNAFQNMIQCQKYFGCFTKHYTLLICIPIDVFQVNESYIISVQAEVLLHYYLTKLIVKSNTYTKIRSAFVD